MQRQRKHNLKSYPNDMLEEGGDGVSLHLGVFFFFFLTYSRANFSDKSGTRLCACQWIFNRCERSRAMRQSIGIYTFTSFFPMPFLCAFRNKPVSSLWEPSQRILAVTLRSDPRLNSWQEMTFAHGRQRAHAHTSGDTGCCFFFKLSSGKKVIFYCMCTCPTLWLRGTMKA